MKTYNRTGVPVVASGSPTMGFFPNGRVRADGRVIRSNRESLYGSNGQVNAGSNKELMQALSYIIESAQRGEFSNQRYESPAQKALEHQKMVQFFNEAKRDDAKWKVIGQKMSDGIYITIDRESFAPVFLKERRIGEGDINRIYVHDKDVVAFFTTTDSTVMMSHVNQRYVFPDEYYLNCVVLIEEREIAQAGPDLLDRKSEDALEAIMTRRDRLLIQLFQRASVVVNAPVYFPAFTPQTLSLLKEVTGRGGPTPVNMLIGYNVWRDIESHPDFVNWYSPLEKHEMFLNGRFGQIMNINIISDTNRHPRMAVTPPGTVLMTCAPEYLGELGIRVEAGSSPVDQKVIGKPVRGWMVFGVESMAVVNAASIGMAIRV